MKLGVFCVLLLLPLVVVGLQSQACVDCTTSSKVWCSEQLTCVNTVEQCTTYPKQWFAGDAECVNSVITASEQCMSYDVEYDKRFTTTGGNMITVPIQPRLWVYDDSANISVENYLLGGYFSYVPPESEQKPYYFFFSVAVGKFLKQEWLPYGLQDKDSETPSNVSFVLQTTDLTVVGNVALSYNMSFVLAKDLGNGSYECAYTRPTIFNQTPVYNDFGFTLGVVGLVIWIVGIFIMINFMMFFEGRGVFKPDELHSKNEKTPLKQEKEKARACSKIAWKEYGKKLVVEWRKFKKSFTASDQMIVSKYGVTVYHYAIFHRLAIVLVVACSVVALLLGFITNVNFGSERDNVAGDFAASTIASLDTKSRTNLTVFFVIILNVAIGAVFIWILRVYSFTTVLAGDTELLPISSFAVEIHGIPKEILDDNMLLEHMIAIHGEGSILSAHIIPNLRRALLVAEEREELSLELAKLVKIEEETNIRPTMYSSFYDMVVSRQITKVDAINFYENAIHALDLLINYEKQRHNEGTGFAYITFKDPEHARKCLTHYNHSTWAYYWRRFVGATGIGQQYQAKSYPQFTAPYASELRVHAWKVSPAPRPEEIVWKNLGVSKKKILLSRLGIILAEIVSFTCILSFTVGFAIFEVYRDLELSEIYYNFGGPTLWATVLSNISIILPEAIAIVDEAVAPIVEALEMRAYHKHFSGWRRTVMWNITFFEMMGGLVLSRMVYFGIGVAVLYHSAAPFDTYHYLFNKIGMDMMKFMCIKTFTVYGIKLAAIGVLKWVEYLVKKEIERPDFDYYDMFGQKIVVLFCLLLWGSTMPLILPLGAMYLAITWMIDKWVILTYYRKEPLSDPKLLFYAADIAGLYIAIVPVCTLIITSTFFRDFLALAVLLIIYSVLMCLWMYFSRRWQNLNQNIKGKRRVVVAQAKSKDVALRWKETIKKATDNKEISGISTLAKRELGTLARGIKHGGIKLALDTHNLAIGDDEVVKHAYKHPLREVNSVIVVQAVQDSP